MEHEKFIADFCKAVDECHGQRPDKLWFSTWMSSKSPYFSFPQTFEKFWLTGELPPVARFSRKISLTLRQSITVGSVLAKSIYIKIAMRNNLRDLSSLKGQKINFLRTTLYQSDPDAKDPFWGDLPELLTQSSMTLITFYDPNFSISKCKSAYNASKHNFPYLAFISPIALLKCHFLLIKEAFTKIDFNTHYSKEIDIKNYLTNSYQTELLSPSCLVNLVFFESFKNILKKFDVQKAYLPFENNPWEKMFYLAMNETKRKFEVIGFQHASIQQGATNYYLSAYENKRHLHPDKILSVGEYTYQYMKSLPFYHNLSLGIGCALRYSYLEDSIQKISDKNDGNINLLILLDGTLGTINLIQIIINFIKINDIKNLTFTIKEHPNLLIKNFYPEFLENEAVVSKKIKIAKDKLQDSLEESDIVLYTGTTSSIEALKMGKAVINYNFSMFNYDPLFQFMDFKWKIHNPMELLAAIHDYLALSPAELMQKRLSSKNFVNNYFSPCTRENIERFL